MNDDEPRFARDYNSRLVQAAERVLIDVGQVLASFRDAIVVIGGWVPELLLPWEGTRTCRQRRC